MKIILPDGWKRPTGYSNAVRASGEMIFVAGQIGWGPDRKFASDDLVDQVRQALSNIVALLAEGGGRPDQITRMTWYVVDMDDYKKRAKEIGVVYREIIGRHYPAMTLFEVSRLVESQALVEIEVTALI
jgi:enamine deaminase RidA (YjgF/YER057c/UK114 family)